MEDIIVPAVVFFSIYKSIQVIADHLFRRRLAKQGDLDKLTMGNGINLNKSRQEEYISDGFTSLKWALVAAFAGVGLIVMHLIGVKNQVSSTEIVNSPVGFGVMLLSIALGFVTYFFIAQHYINKKK